jgi:hypothetical protein
MIFGKGFNGSDIRMSPDGYLYIISHFGGTIFRILRTSVTSQQLREYARYVNWQIGKTLYGMDSSQNIMNKIQIGIDFIKLFQSLSLNVLSNKNCYEPFIGKRDL